MKRKDRNFFLIQDNMMSALGNIFKTGFEKYENKLYECVKSPGNVERNRKQK